ncbi:MAG: hypothetical protein MUF71_05050 [Candidatus Kapabacteria bacterium]|jgi:hypothetical protein|nr:hypothetical protein [Candidatus Kapabacteria bacterium]
MTNVFSTTQRIIACCVLLVLASLSGCDFPTATEAASAQQDFQTTGFRYVNMTNIPDGQYIGANFRTFSLASRDTLTVSTDGSLVAQFAASPFISAKADSGRVVITTATGQILYAAPPFLFTTRNARYTFVGLPTVAGSRLGIDTVIVLQSIPTDTLNNAINIRIVNCINDSRKTYSFTIGCPSGTPLGGAIAYRRTSGIVPVSVVGGALSLALTEQTTTATGVVSTQKGLFTLNRLNPGNSYSVFLYTDNGGNIRLLGLNERNTESLDIITSEAPSTYVRVANFSSNPLSGVSYGTNSVSGNLAARSLSPYEMLTACGSIGRDTLRINRQSTATSQQITTTLDVNGSQTVFVHDTLAFAVPTNTRVPGGDSVIIRAVNLSPENVTVVRGATTSQSARQIASLLAPGAVSAPFVMPRGGASMLQPFIVFNPDSVQQNGITALPDATSRAYFLVIERRTMTLIPDVAQQSGMMPQTTTFTPMPVGALFQAINAFGEMTRTLVSLGNVLQDTLGYGATALTVLPAGVSQMMFMDGIPSANSITPVVRRSYVVIGSGFGANRSVIVERGLWSPVDLGLRPSPAQSVVRYFNATANISNLLVGNSESDNTFIVRAPLAQNRFTPVVSDSRFYSSITRTLTFNNDTIRLFTARNLTFQRGKGYTVIFTGRALRDTVYNALVLQEQ